MEVLLRSYNTSKDSNNKDEAEKCTNSASTVTSSQEISREIDIRSSPVLSPSLDLQQELIGSLNSYCWCDFDYNQHGLTKEQVKSLNSLLVESACNIYNTSQEESYMTKDNVYLKLLEGFNYEHHQTISEKSGKAHSSYKCMFDGCNKTFNRAWNLLNHANMHKGVKPYKCQMCDKSFTQKGNLKKHITTHLLPDLKNRKRYLCQVCGKSYTEKYNYKAHMSKKHPELKNVQRQY